MKIDLTLNAEELAFFNELKKKNDLLIVPLDGWIRYIHDNPNIKPEDMPIHLVSGYNVITEKEWFGSLARNISVLHYYPVRIIHELGAFWYDKLESKKKMPKHDIYDAGHRQSGSFRSKG